jgi:hypothetical protein
LKFVIVENLGMTALPITNGKFSMTISQSKLPVLHSCGNQFAPKGAAKAGNYFCMRPKAASFQV